MLQLWWIDFVRPVYNKFLYTINEDYKIKATPELVLIVQVRWTNMKSTNPAPSRTWLSAIYLSTLIVTRGDIAALDLLRSQPQTYHSFHYHEPD